MSRQSAKFISSFCVAMALSDDAKKENPKEKSQNIVKPSKLPIYEEPQDLYSYEYFGKEKTKLEEGVSFARKELQSAFEATSDARESIKNVYETGKSHSLVTADYLLDDANVPAKVGAITVGGLLGLLIGGRRKGFVKKLFYTTLGATGTAALVYPKEASQISRELYDNAGDYSLIAYNFVAGVKPQNENNQSQPSVPQEPQKTKTPPSEVSSHPHPQQDHRSFRSLLRQSRDVSVWGFRLFDRKDVSTLPSSRLYEEPSMVSVKESLTSSNKNKFSESDYESSDSVTQNNNVIILRDTKNSTEIQDVSSQNKSDSGTYSTKLNDSLDPVQQYNIHSDTSLDTSSESQVINRKNKSVSNSLKEINTNSYNSSICESNSSEVNSNSSLLGSNSIIVDSNTIDSSTNNSNLSIGTDLRKRDSELPVIKSKSHEVNDNLYLNESNSSAPGSDLSNIGFDSSTIHSNSSKDCSNSSTSTVSLDSSTVRSNSPIADSNSSIAEANLTAAGSKSPIPDSISSIASSNSLISDSNSASETLQPSARKTFDPDPQPSKGISPQDEFVDELSDVLIDSVLNLRIFGIKEEENSDSKSTFSYSEGDKNDSPPKRSETPSKIQEDSSGSPFENFADKMIDSMLNLRIVEIDDEGNEGSSAGLDVNEREVGKTTDDTDVNEGRNATDTDSNKENISDWKDTRGIADDLLFPSSLKQKIKSFFSIKKQKIIEEEEDEKDISEMDKMFVPNGKDIAADVSDLEGSKESASDSEDWNPSTPNLKDSYSSPEENFETNEKVSSYVPRRTPAAETKTPPDKQMATDTVNHDGNRAC